MCIRDSLYNKHLKKEQSITNRLFGQIVWSAEQIASISEYFAKNQVVVFTTALSAKAVNVFHVHLPVIGIQPSVDAKYFKEIDLPNQLKEFAGITNKEENAVKYRVLISEIKISHVLYSFKGQAGTVNFTEVSYRQGEILNVKELKYPQVNYAKLQFIPMQVVAELGVAEQAEPMETSAPTHELVSACCNRFSENLTGYVDIELIPESEYRPTSFKEISIPICECAKDQDGHKWMESMSTKWNKNIKELIVRISKRVNEAIQKYQHTYNDIEKMKSLMEEYNELEGELISLPDDSLTFEDAVTSRH
eukprot:TRINITY_DN5749_c0_g1_i4.p1 TRINITY_DN5749_c0_g1~~TRINITY_DN5749_c0_g1_i4.p1  ORF type:complete len:306 (-),score=49.16 TRINITY_DN5749_c0_g1_i4:202-1119(-)